MQRRAVTLVGIAPFCRVSHKLSTVAARKSRRRDRHTDRRCFIPLLGRGRTTLHPAAPSHAVDSIIRYSYFSNRRCENGSRHDVTSYNVTSTKWVSRRHLAVRMSRLRHRSRPGENDRQAGYPRKWFTPECLSALQGVLTSLHSPNT